MRPILFWSILYRRGWGLAGYVWWSMYRRRVRYVTAENRWTRTWSSTQWLTGHRLSSPSHVCRIWDQPNVTMSSSSSPTSKTSSATASSPRKVDTTPLLCSMFVLNRRNNNKKCARRVRPTRYAPVRL